jgi:hypothetical protein
MVDGLRLEDSPARRRSCLGSAGRRGPGNRCQSMAWRCGRERLEEASRVCRVPGYAEPSSWTGMPAPATTRKPRKPASPMGPQARRGLRDLCRDRGGSRGHDERDGVPVDGDRPDGPTGRSGRRLGRDGGIPPGTVPAPDVATLNRVTRPSGRHWRRPSTGATGTGRRCPPAPVMRMPVPQHHVAYSAPAWASTSDAS